MRLVGAIERNYSRKDLAKFLAAVLARSYRDQQRLAALATRDALTGLYNRRGFYGYLAQWSSWSARYSHPLGVLLVDVDYFKVVNDTLGHPAGDEALKSISDALRRAVRGSDLVGRYGGDEFAILAPETTGEELAELAERVLEMVRSTRFQASGETMELSVSIGAASASGAESVTAEELLSAADKSLYEAKNAGRDRAGHVIAVAAK
jgi:diguanylate cyclase (GGDEF)-like protein